MFFLILADQLVPFLFLLRPALNRRAKMRQRLIGNVEELVFRPAQMFFRFAHCVFTGSVAVRLAGARGRHAIPNCGFDGNQRRTIGN